jgi:hypothetical protein
MTQEPLFTMVLDSLQEYPLNARRVPFFGASIFEKLAITTPVFALFLPPQNHETLINSQFQIL